MPPLAVLGGFAACAPRSPPNHVLAGASVRRNDARRERAGSARSGGDYAAQVARRVQTCARRGGLIRQHHPQQPGQTICHPSFRTRPLLQIRLISAHEDPLESWPRLSVHHSEERRDRFPSSERDVRTCPFPSPRRRSRKSLPIKMPTPASHRTIVSWQHLTHLRRSEADAPVCIVAAVTIARCGSRDHGNRRRHRVQRRQDDPQE